MNPSDEKKKVTPRKKPQRKPSKSYMRKLEVYGIEGILLLLEEQNLSPAVEWYVKRLSEVYDEIAAGKAPKVKLEILQELRDFIIPADERKPITEIFDPAATDLKMTGSDHA